MILFNDLPAAGDVVSEPASAGPSAGPFDKALSGRPDPDMIVVKSATADRRRLVCTDQCVDTATAFKTAVWPDALGYHDAAPDLVVLAHVQDDFAQLISDLDLLSVSQAIGLQVLRMHEQFRPAFAF